MLSIEIMLIYVLYLLLAPARMICRAGKKVPKKGPRRLIPPSGGMDPWLSRDAAVVPGILALMSFTGFNIPKISIGQDVSNLFQVQNFFKEAINIVYRGLKPGFK